LRIGRRGNLDTRLLRRPRGELRMHKRRQHIKARHAARLENGPATKGQGVLLLVARRCRAKHAPTRLTAVIRDVFPTPASPTTVRITCQRFDPMLLQRLWARAAGPLDGQSNRFQTRAATEQRGAAGARCCAVRGSLGQLPWPLAASYMRKIVSAQAIRLFPPRLLASVVP
jgi:hypothetical protein